MRSESFHFTFIKDENGSNLSLFPFVLSTKHEKTPFFTVSLTVPIKIRHQIITTVRFTRLSYRSPQEVFWPFKIRGQTLNAVGGVWSHGPAWGSPTDPGYQRVWRGASVSLPSPAPSARRFDQLSFRLSLLCDLPPVYVFITFKFMTDLVIFFFNLWSEGAFCNSW